jgi:hypothetical protein
MSLDYIRKHYGVPADIGRKITFEGQTGVIVGYNGANLKVNFDDAKPNKSEYLHPTWYVEYGDVVIVFDPMGDASLLSDFTSDVGMSHEKLTMAERVKNRINKTLGLL